MSYRLYGWRLTGLHPSMAGEGRARMGERTGDRIKKERTHNTDPCATVSRHASVPPAKQLVHTRHTKAPWDPTRELITPVSHTFPMLRTHSLPLPQRHPNRPCKNPYHPICAAQLPRLSKFLCTPAHPRGCRVASARHTLPPLPGHHAALAAVLEKIVVATDMHNVLPHRAAVSCGAAGAPRSKLL
ncbi:hypothetical protein FIBSPDRAFT_884150 [Athelia psychrophila]|uniref:Uncharacterized protein n=1 Tax=Athelia psychrophila TaxID=1759441 RepID=A0A166THK0_9AGAM|nr:hypothetical protein FIBSPDRAFT_884150 [Fibularhizoctonia sp. CBS 109695]